MENHESTHTTAIDVDNEFDAIINANYAEMPVYGDTLLTDERFDEIISEFETALAPEVDYATPPVAPEIAQPAPELAPEEQSRMRKFGRKLLEYGTPTIVGASVLGAVAWAAFASKHGLDPSTTVHGPSPAIDSTPFSKPLDTPLGNPNRSDIHAAALGNIDTPAPAPNHPPIVSNVIQEAAPVKPKKTFFPTGEKTPAPKPAQKEVVVLTGGATDPNADFIEQQLIENGTIDPSKVTIIKNHYPAEMAPFVGQTSTQESTRLAAEGIRNAIAQNPNSKITSYAFSEGNFGNDTVGAEQYRLGNKNVNFVGYGSGNAASGLLNSPLAEAFRPIVDGLGIVRTPPAPGTTMILDGSDGYASNAGGDIGKLLNNAMGPGHRIVGPNEPRVMTFDVAGVHYEVVGNAIPLPPGAILTSGTPAPGFGGIPELRPADLMPNGPAPIDPNVKAPNFVPDMNTLPPAPAEPVRSATPSFFGEAACVAPDGSQYFTPGNAPC